MCPRPERLEAWSRLVRDLDPSKLEAITTEIGLTDVVSTSERLMAGGVRGRVIVDVNR